VTSISACEAETSACLWRGHIDYDGGAIRQGLEAVSISEHIRLR